MTFPDLLYYAFWWTVAGVIIVLFILPIASFLLTAALTVVALQVGLLLAFVGYLVGIPWAVYRRVVDGEWPGAE